jgi:hypothetical protein
MAAPTAAWFRGIILKVIVIALVALVLSFVKVRVAASSP